MQVEGTILAGSELDPVEGRVVVEGDRIVAVEETPTDSSSTSIPLEAWRPGMWRQPNC